MRDPDKIILGTVQFGLNYGINNSTGQPDKNKVFEILEFAFEHGIKTLDAAEAYGTAHALIGEFHRIHPKFAVNTKLTRINDDPELQVNSLLEELNIDEIDTLMFHSPGQFSETSEKTIEKLAELKKHGKLKKIGVSVYTNADAEKAAMNTHVSVVQLPFNLLDNSLKRSNTINFLNQNNTSVHVRSIYLQGLFFKHPADISGNLKDLVPYIEKIRQIASKAQTDIRKLAMSYAMTQSNIEKIIIGVDNMEQLRSNFTGHSYQLPQNIKEEIDNIDVADHSLLYPFNWKL